MEALEQWFKPEIIWFMMGVLFLILEFILPGLIIFFFGVSACLVGVLCFFMPLSLNHQLALFLVLSIVFILSLRKYLKKIFIGKLKVNPRTDGSVDDYIGKKVTVVEAIGLNQSGKIEFNGSNWSAESDSEIEVGKTAEIIAKDNITFKVKPV